MLFQCLTAFETEPAFIDACKSAKAITILEEAVLHQEIEVAEAPRCKAKTGHAEKPIEDLRVDLDPFLTWGGIGGTASWTLVAHGGSGIEEDEKDHGAPRDDVESVYDHKETKGCQRKLPKPLAADHGRFPPSVLRWEAVAIRIRA